MHIRFGLGPGRTAKVAVGVARTFLPRHRTQKQFDAVRCESAGHPRGTHRICSKHEKPKQLSPTVDQLAGSDQWFWVIKTAGRWQRR